MEDVTRKLEGFTLTTRPPPNTPAPERPPPTVLWGDWTDRPDNAPRVLCVRPFSLQDVDGGSILTGDFAVDSQSQSGEEATSKFEEYWIEHGLSHVESSLTDEEATRVIHSLWRETVKRSAEACIHHDSVLVVRPRVQGSAGHHELNLGVTITPLSDIPHSDTQIAEKYTTLVSIPLICVEGVNGQDPLSTPESTYQRDLTGAIEVFDGRLSDIE